MKFKVLELHQWLFPSEASISKGLQIFILKVLWYCSNVKVSLSVTLYAEEAK